jgi:hypothetical protein
VPRAPDLGSVTRETVSSRDLCPSPHRPEPLLISNEAGFAVLWIDCCYDNDRSPNKFQ